MIDLIPTLEAATKGSRELDGDIAELIQPPALKKIQQAHLHTLKREENRKGYHSVDRGEWSRDTPTQASWKAPHYTTSLDDSLVLVPSGWTWAVILDWVVARGFFGHAKLTPDEAGQSTEGIATTPALALCIAVLKAKADG